jgi:hypothetical protein
MRPHNVLALSIVVVLAVAPALGHQSRVAKPGQPVFMAANGLAWTDLDPAGAPGVKVVDLWGDHAKGAFGAFFKLPAGFAAPLHTHTHAMKVVFVSGTYIQAPEGKPEVRLGPGSYMMQPGGNYRHTTVCDKASDCVFFVESDGLFDLKPVEAEKGPAKK